MRGTGGRDSANRWPDGIIPACAGNRSVLLSNQISLQDHPRVCGEQEEWDAEGIDDKGSSPRVRGTVRTFCIELGTIGIIPACAGNSTTLINSGTLSRDHPRVCGEQVESEHLLKRTIGSSPRVRGTATFPCLCAYIKRIIPACAGNRDNYQGSRKAP